MNRIIQVALFVFFALNLNAATFTSFATGNWNASGSWTHTGFDADNIPDLDDDVTIQGNHTITLQALSDCVDLIINAGCTLNFNSRNIRVRGDFIRNGVTLSVSHMYFYGNPATIAIAGTFTNGGNWNFMNGCNVSIAPGSNILKVNYFYIQDNARLTNRGNVALTGGSISPSGTGLFTNWSTGTFSVAQPLLGNSSNYNFAISGNRMRYNGNSANPIMLQTYHHLDLLSSGSSTKTWSGGNLTVNGDFRIFAGTTVDCANQFLNVGGNWINFAGINCTNQIGVNMIGSSQVIQSANLAGEGFNNLTIMSSGTVTLARAIICAGSLAIVSGTLDVGVANHQITLSGTWQDNGNFTARQGTVRMLGSTPQAIDGVSSTVFYNLTISNTSSITVNFIKTISNILTVTTGSFGPSAFGTVILSATGTTTYARIAPLGALASLTGTGWVVQTFVNGPATAYWQYVSSPVAATTLADWDNDTRFYMSGVGGNDGNACCPVFRSVRTYSETTNTYTNVTTTATPLTPGRGIMVWMADNVSSLTAPLVFDTRGTPNFNTVNRAVTAGGAGAGYNLVGNPYACPVTYASVAAASSASLSPNFVILQENGSYATNPNGGTIAAAQGFMCIASTGGNITFTESCKSLVANPNVMRVLSGNQIRIKAGNAVNGLGEETVVKLDAAGDESYDMFYDLPYLASPYENATHVYTQNSLGEQFILNNIGTTQDHLTIPVAVVTSTPGTQILTFKDLSTVTEYNCAWLEDLETGARINLNQYDTYQFEEAEMGATRNFVLHFERTNDCTFDLQTTATSLDAATNVYVSGEMIFAQFEFEVEEIVTVSMFDLSGRMVMGEKTMNVGTQTIVLDNPDAHGIYLVRIQKGNEISTKKIYY